jgi:dihydropteroate synthase
MGQAIKRKHFKVPAGRFNLHLGSRTFIMGIINLTYDSFSKDGLLRSKKNTSFLARNALGLARKMKKNGADIIDIGGQSTRPGARPISVKEELTRVIPTVKTIASYLNIPISVDTYKPEVAEAAIEAGASIINNIMSSDLECNKQLAEVCAKKNRALVIMHIRGTPLNMQQFTKYKSVITEIKSELTKAINAALNSGLNFSNIIIDPGIGFAKTYQQNLEIINRLDEFVSLNRPILIGVSRKSFIGRALNLDVDERIFGTAACLALAVRNGSHIVRVHDCYEMAQVATMADAILNYN